ncbi:MAG: Flp pilus assembly complex ATPase component TadA [Chloroflexi bacterium]|nr:Flp pilus assembly complex ATPase component TadA [Chloroflexota bacterium]
MTETGYDQVLPQLQDVLIRRGVSIPAWRANAKERGEFAFAVARVLAEERMLPSGEARSAAGDLANRMMGLGVLDPFLHQDGVEEIIVRNGTVLIGRNGQVGKSGVIAPDLYFYALAQRVAEMGGKPLRAANPFVLVDLPDGSRFTAMVPPLSRRGTAINIRVFSRRVLSVQDLVRVQMLSRRQADYLNEVVLGRRKSLLVSGRPAAGKTTLLNALLALLPENTQLCGAETFEEIVTSNPFEARAVVRDQVEAGRVTMAEVVNVLYTRMRPDVVVVGEVVSEEAKEYLQAINLGVVAHTTIHGNSVLDALLRLETLAREKEMPLGAIRERIARGLGVGVHVDLKLNAEGTGWQRQVTEIVEISGDSERYILRPIAGDHNA